MARRRYLDTVALSDNTTRVIGSTMQQIRAMQKDTPARRQSEQRKAEVRKQYARVMPINPRYASIGPYREHTALDKAGGRLYAAAEQRRKDEADGEAVGPVLDALFKPITISSYVDMYKAYKRGDVNNLIDALAAPYLTNSSSSNNSGQALALSLLTPAIAGKGAQLVYKAVNAGLKLGKRNVINTIASTAIRPTPIRVAKTLRHLPSPLQKIPNSYT